MSPSLLPSSCFYRQLGGTAGTTCKLWMHGTQGPERYRELQMQLGCADPCGPGDVPDKIDCQNMIEYVYCIHMSDRMLVVGIARRSCDFCCLSLSKKCVEIQLGVLKVHFCILLRQFPVHYTLCYQRVFFGSLQVEYASCSGLKV